MNDRENEDHEEEWRLPIGKGGVVAVGGRLGPHAYVVGKVAGSGGSGGSGVWLQVNGRKERTSEVWVETKTAPHVVASPQSEATITWDAAARRTVAEVRHEVGAVEVEVKAGR
jgi:hypothetical protein